MIKILVLDDGETYSNLRGCTIYEVPDHWSDEIIEAAIAGYDEIMDDDGKWCEFDPDEMVKIGAFG